MEPGSDSSVGYPDIRIPGTTSPSTVVLFGMLICTVAQKRRGIGNYRNISIFEVGRNWMPCFPVTIHVTEACLVYKMYFSPRKAWACIVCKIKKDCNVTIFNNLDRTQKQKRKA